MIAARRPLSSVFTIAADSGVRRRYTPLTHHREMRLVNTLASSDFPTHLLAGVYIPPRFSEGTTLILANSFILDAPTIILIPGETPARVRLGPSSCDLLRGTLAR